MLIAWVIGISMVMYGHVQMECRLLFLQCFNYCKSTAPWKFKWENAYRRLGNLSQVNTWKFSSHIFLTYQELLPWRFPTMKYAKWNTYIYWFTYWFISLSFISCPFCHSTRSDRLPPMSLVPPTWVCVCVDVMNPHVLSFLYTLHMRVCMCLWCSHSVFKKAILCCTQPDPMITQLYVTIQTVNNFICPFTVYKYIRRKNTPTTRLQ